MRYMVTGGGTGGHVYPALSVLDALVALPAAGATPDDILWVGGKAGVERTILTRTAYRYAAVATGPLHGANLLQMVASLAKMVKGTCQSLGLLRHWKPVAVLGTGGFVSVPLVLACWLRRVPVLLYLPDMEPGKAIKVLARISRRVAVSFPPTARYFGDKAVITGYPVRQALFSRQRDEARKELNLDEGRPTVLVMGGSRGARSINQALQQGLSELLAQAQIVHITGPLDYQAVAEAREALPIELRQHYYVYEYLHDEMVAALLAADLVIARSGAATLGEFPAVGVPAILVPYPYAGQHQALNAAYLERADAALVLEDERLGKELVPAVLTLLADPARLAAMSAASRAMSVPDAARRIANELVGLAKEERHD